MGDARQSLSHRKGGSIPLCPIQYNTRQNKEWQMPKNFNDRDKKLNSRKNFKADNRKSVRDLNRMILEKARDIQEKKHRQIKENALGLDNES